MDTDDADVLTDDHKLSFRSNADVKDALARIVSTVGRDRAIRYKTSRDAKPKRPTRTAVFNALLLWAADLPEATLRAGIGAGIAQLNAMAEAEGVTPEGTVGGERPDPAVAKTRGRA